MSRAVLRRYLVVSHPEPPTCSTLVRRGVDEDVYTLDDVYYAARNSTQRLASSQVDTYSSASPSAYGAP